MEPKFLKSPHGDSAQQGMDPNPPGSAAQDAHDGAPAGRFFSEQELPVVAVPGGDAASTGGFSPQPSNPPFPDPFADPTAKPVSGVRR